jgi:D-alanyl-D-alanine carboxypeptidase (penicillin-binding protein 5/6)
MKRIVSIAIIIAFLTPVIHFSAWAEPLMGAEDIDISAPNAILMEKETGTVIYEKNAHERLFPASVTKVMTMLLIVEDIESGKLSLDDVVTASQRASSFGGSCVYLEQGEQMTVREMLKCIAVVSANDCAVAMAEHISGSESLFVERMNRRAQELGMEDTHFTSCSGLFDDGKHYTTAYDVAVMSRELIGHELIKEFTTIWMDSIRDGNFELSNTNKLVYWYPGCTGLKTGYTSTAKYCLAATAMRDGVEYIAVIMHADSSDSRNKDAETLLDVAFANYSLCPLTMEQNLPELAVELGKSASLSLSYGGEKYALVASGSQEPEYSLQLPEKVQSPVNEGDTVGTLRVSLGGQEVAAVPIVAAETVERIGFWGMLGLLGGSLFGL